MRNMKYRADIDGLRALAVTLVVFYHVGLGFFSGGFIGVDIFFVISGYLITSIIKSDVQRGEFLFSRFFSRRIKRIVPGLFVVLLFTSATALFVLFPDDLVTYARSLIATSLSFSNYFLINHTSDYFSLSVEQLPLLHTWSLSVEEQFYIVWPLVFLLVFKKTKGKLVSVITIATLSALASCAYSSYLVTYWPAASYYSLFSRVFELVIGCLVALVAPRLKTKHVMQSFISFASLLVILCVSVFINKDSNFPGVLALLPCFAAAAFIISGNGENPGLANSLLSNKFFVYIGKLSYPIYLWHWPIIAYFNYYGIEKTNFIAVVIIGATILLSAITYHFVEMPIKSGVSNKLSSTFVIILLPMLLFSTLFGFITIKKNGYEWRFNDIQSYLTPSNNPEIVRKQCFNSYDLTEHGFCQLGVAGGKEKGIFIGDSMAGHYMAFVDVLAKDAGVSVVGSASSGLPPVYDVKSHPVSAFQRNADMLKYNIERLKIAHSFDFVILAAGWGNEYPYFESETAISEAVQEFVKSGVRVFIILRPNGLEKSLMKRAMFTIARHGNVEHIIAPMKASVNGRAKYIQQSEMVTVIDPNKALCSAGECNVSIDGELIYIDKDHITEFGAKALGARYLSDHKNPLKEHQPLMK